VNGTLVLQGEVADQATADTIRTALADSFGAAAIVDQFRIVSDAPFTDADPLAAGNAVRFPAGQPTTDLASLRFLDQVADLLARHAGVTADVHVTADGGGSALARQRAAVVRQYLGGRGVSADRLTSTGDTASGSTAQLVVIFHHLPG
jgi:outer membrane protein OmpA-like peptidoglycan-associated protein